MKPGTLFSGQTVAQVELRFDANQEPVHPINCNDLRYLEAAYAVAVRNL